MRGAGNRLGAIGVLQYVFDDASLNACLTTSRLIWLAVLIAFAGATRLLRGILSNTCTPSSSASSGPTFQGGFPRKTLPKIYF